MKKQAKLHEKAITEIIKRFGEKIDLKKSPFLVAEIAKQFQELTGSGGIKAACAPPGGIKAECAPPGGPPKRGEDLILQDNIIKEISKLSNSMKLLNKKVDALKNK